MQNILSLKWLTVNYYFSLWALKVVLSYKQIKEKPKSTVNVYLKKTLISSLKWHVTLLRNHGTFLLFLSYFKYVFHCCLKIL